MDPILAADRLRRLLWRHLTPAGNAVALPVAAAATSVAVTFARAEQDTAYGVTACPSWGTTVWVSAKSATGCTLSFGTGAPGGGGTVDLTVFRSED